MATNACCALSVERRGASVSRHVKLVCTPGIAAPCANEIIGRSTKLHVNCELPSYVMRRFSRTHRRRKTAPFASCGGRYLGLDTGVQSIRLPAQRRRRPVRTSRLSRGKRPIGNDDDARRRRYGTTRTIHVRAGSQLVRDAAFDNTHLARPEHTGRIGIRRRIVTAMGIL